jgi:hypothetical protein
MTASFWKIGSFARSTIHKELTNSGSTPDVEGLRDPASERERPREQLGATGRVRLAILCFVRQERAH